MYLRCEENVIKFYLVTPYDIFRDIFNKKKCKGSQKPCEININRVHFKSFFEYSYL